VRALSGGGSPSYHDVFVTTAQIPRLCDAVQAWSDCNRAIGHIYRVDEDWTEAFRTPGETITIYVPQSEMTKFAKRFGDNLSDRCPSCHVEYRDLPEGHRGAAARVQDRAGSRERGAVSGEEELIPYDMGPDCQLSGTPFRDAILRMPPGPSGADSGGRHPGTDRPGMQGDAHGQPGLRGHVRRHLGREPARAAGGRILPCLLGLPRLRRAARPPSGGPARL
jgi:hypothetical protein